MRAAEPDSVDHLVVKLPASRCSAALPPTVVDQSSARDDRATWPVGGYLTSIGRRC
jgi:hypothetical protein